MIASAHRFRGLGSLRYVYKNGRTVRGRHLSLKHINNTHRQSFRCAVVVSKRVNKSAVVRNRLRRRIYELVRLQSDQIKEPQDMVFTVFDERLSAGSAESLQKEISSLLLRAGITDKVKPVKNVMIEQQEK
ncbi:ribonuclease P protein component [Candidatus Saccharibacteria bacterium RIFCSPHIGHO2_02_FULL_47_12]|nr:MAG: ribonuclease P protein component [Candidatus Saccharibacteria bacterium RIFCSPHIGHO2_02_FULL_47_12]